MRAPTVELHEITRRFGAVTANDHVSLELVPGEIHALVGENGAGKSTLMRQLYGLLQPDSGEFRIAGRVVRIPDPAAAMQLGLGMVHQHFMLVDTLTVAENVVLGREPRSAMGWFDRARAEREVAELGARHGLAVDPRARIAQLGVGAQQRVEILKALARGARVLILDEPTAVLTPQEADELFAVLRALRQDGAAIVFITHKLAEVKALADRVTVMRAGRVVGSAPAAGLSVERIAEWMVGRAIAPLGARGQAHAGAPRIVCEQLEVRDERGLPAVRGISLQVCAGEIVGIAGVEGNGQHELLEAIAGLRPAHAGRITIAGHVCTGGARAHRAAGLAHIPSDRLHRGLVPGFSLAENLMLGQHRGPHSGHGVGFGGRRMHEHAQALLQAFDVRPAASALHAQQLSGGNQQKLIAARELSGDAPAILAAHPTRGVDLGAVDFLHRRLLAERDAGRAVLLVSSELSELLALSDRILVLYEGRIVHETTPAQTDERTLGLYMTGRGAAPAAHPDGAGA